MTTIPINDQEKLAKIVLGDLWAFIPPIAQRPLARRLCWFAEYVVECVMRLQQEEVKQHERSG